MPKKLHCKYLLSCACVITIDISNVPQQLAVPIRQEPKQGNPIYILYYWFINEVALKVTITLQWQIYEGFVGFHETPIGLDLVLRSTDDKLTGTPLSS